jgi:hypothetical protein
MTTAKGPCGRSFTIIEVVMSALVVSVLLAASLNLVSRVRVSQASMEWRRDARRMAESLLAVVVAQRFMEPSPSGTRRNVLGTDETESLSVLSTLDDVDDFANAIWSPADVAGWIEPPGDQVGTWRIGISVSYVDPMRPSVSSGAVTTAKSVTVTVRRNTVVLESLSAVRSQGVAP